MASELQAYLAQVSEMAPRGYPRVLLEHGCHWGGAGRVFSAGPLGHCYANTLKVVEHTPGAEYWEGLALYEGIPIEHAWAVIDGTLVETTWPELAPEYWGLRIPLAEVYRSQRVAGYHGYLANDYLRGHELARQGPPWKGPKWTPTTQD